MDHNVNIKVNREDERDANQVARLKHWNVLEYLYMTELGILNPDEQAELISGQIYLWLPKERPMYWLFVYWRWLWIRC
jgi:hypothetical protein